MDGFQVFNSTEFGSLELLLDKDKIFFPATRCAKILGYTNVCSNAK
jgi:prophage antirepressor-like protein